MNPARGVVDGGRGQYLAAEEAFWGHYDLEPTTRIVQVGTPRSRLRVQELGAGEAVVFVHGTGGAGAYFAPLLAEMTGFRCIVLDRPGWGLSEPVDYSSRDYASIVGDVLRDTLDALGVERADIVGASIGDLWALRVAMREPSRIGRVVLLGGGPISPAVRVPPFIRLLRSPLGALIVRAPEKPASFRKQLSSMGHAAALDAGVVPQAFVDWHVALTRHTEWARRERDMVQSIIGRGSFVPGLVPTERETAALEAPTLMVYGTRDPVGSVEVWRRFVAGLPHGELDIVEDGGHLVWLDDPAGVGKRVSEFLAR